MATKLDPIDVDEMLAYTGYKQFKAVYTVTLAELIEIGIFDWSKDYLTWSSFAYDSAQYERVCQYFIDRFYYREISMEPFKIWANFLTRKIKYELMPKYKILYVEAAKNVSLQGAGNETRTKTESESSDNYYKSRDIQSEYPETLLSSNSDYISTGNDTEDERIIEREHTENESVQRDAPASVFIENTARYAEVFGQIDKQLCDELEVMFVSLYSANINGL